MEPNESCWCGHQAQWHRQNKTYPDLYVCKWCIKMQLRGKIYCEYEHQMAIEIPELMMERAVAVFDKLVDTELRTDPLITPQMSPPPEKRPRRTRGKGRFIKGMAPPPYLKLVE